jgi:hypothetical protein
LSIAMPGVRCESSRSSIGPVKPGRPFPFVIQIGVDVNREGAAAKNRRARRADEVCITCIKSLPIEAVRGPAARDILAAVD